MKMINILKKILQNSMFEQKNLRYVESSIATLIQRKKTVGFVSVCCDKK